jgi:hypothetical protein
MRSASHVASSAIAPPRSAAAAAIAASSAGGPARSAPPVPSRSISPTCGAHGARELDGPRPVREPERQLRRGELDVLHDEVVVERPDQRVAERRRHREHDRALADHHVQIRLDLSLLLDEEAVGRLARRELGELLRDEAVQPRQPVLAGEHDRCAIGRGDDEDAVSGCRREGHGPVCGTVARQNRRRPLDAPGPRLSG